MASSAVRTITLDNTPVPAVVAERPAITATVQPTRILEVVLPRRQHGLNKTFRHIGKTKLWVITAARQSPCQICKEHIEPGQTITLYAGLGWGHASHLQPTKAGP